MGTLSIWHWLIVLAIVLLVFGTRKLRSAGSDLGGALRNFKQAMKEGEADAPKTPEQLAAEERTAASAEQQKNKV